jgi:hypothetical protein
MATLLTVDTLRERLTGHHVAFDAPSHTYTWDGAQRPSVTQILSAVGHNAKLGHVAPSVLHAAARRGTAWHAAAEAALTDVDTPAADIPLQKFIAALGRESWRVIATEQPLIACLAGLHVAGTPDAIVAQVTGRDQVVRLMVVDFKTTAARASSHAVQAEAYSCIVEALAPECGPVLATVVYRKPFRYVRTQPTARWAWMTAVRQFTVLSLPTDAFFK